MSSKAKTLVFLPCCKRKDPTGNVFGGGVAVTQNDLPQMWNALIQGRGHHQNNLRGRTLTSALLLYQGLLYQNMQPCIQGVKAQFNSETHRGFILAPPYGVVDAREPIKNYNLDLTGPVAAQWRTVGLADILSELILRHKPKHVFGYFCGPKAWNAGRNMARWFFTEAATMARQHVRNPGTWGCFHNVAGNAPALRVLGDVLCDHAGTGFDPRFANNMINQHHVRRAGTIGFDPI